MEGTTARSSTQTATKAFSSAPGPSESPGLAERLIAAQEQERRRIARELHDDLGQHAVLLEMQAQRLAAVLADGPAHELLEEMLEQLRALEEGIRALSHDLCPAPLAEFDIESALRALVEKFRANGAPVRMLSRGEWAAVPREAGLAIYRIAQEALRNAVRHAPGAPVRLALSLTPGEIRLLVKDHGPGFDIRAAREHGGLGLASMLERARMAEGTLKLRTRLGEGTSVSVRVPRPKSGTLPRGSISGRALG